MSKEFLTQQQAGEKLKKTATGNDFVTKQQVIAMGADPNKLAKYTNNQYPVNEDIVQNYEPSLFSIAVDVHLSINQHNDILSIVGREKYIGDIGKVVILTSSNI